MTDFAQDDASLSQEEEALREAIINDSLPAGLIEPDWLEMPELEPDWLELPTLEPNWLEMPELEPEWLVGLDHDETELTLDSPELEPDGDELEH